MVDWMEPILAIDPQDKELNVGEQIPVIGYVADPEINENTEIHGEGPEMNEINTENPGGDDEEESHFDSSSLSDCPSWMFEDFEGPQDDDIFAIKHNPTSNLILQVDRNLNPPVLETMYFCLVGMGEGFLAGCRPIIGLDGCFLKGMYKGQLLTAIDIGFADEKGWAFISDSQKGLVEAVHSFAPTSEYRFCLKHMYNNFKAKHNLKKLFGMLPPLILVSYPCCHDVASLNYHNMSYDDYIDDYLKKDMYMRVYSHMINHVPGMHDFEESPLGSVDPPNVKVRVGRPRKHNNASGNANNVEAEAAQEEEQAQTNIDPQFESETAEGRPLGTNEQTPMEFDAAPLFERPSYSEYTRHVESVQFNSNVNATPLFQMHQQPSQTASSLANEGPRADVHLPTQAFSVANVHLPKPPSLRKQSCPKLKRPQSQPQTQKKKGPPTSIAF
ncbi:hypothetical protein BUALT_Bualt04G0025100 [Buddleja alternifolia]|uniref:Uncharacterized protein n=1 Tax=Buddleja alternifolia TaxID=168488 RepID=A0AAV6XMN1_9LAMI|nr:hypothetical protein BUALT_Bualt04G0025100 [Buddleja alternifolia]